MQKELPEEKRQGSHGVRGAGLTLDVFADREREPNEKYKQPSAARVVFSQYLQLVRPAFS